MVTRVRSPSYDTGAQVPNDLDALLGLLRRGDHDEAIGIGIRERTPEHAVGDGENRGVEADAERERGEGGEGERRIAPQQSQRVTHVLCEGFERRHTKDRGRTFTLAGHNCIPRIVGGVDNGNEDGRSDATQRRLVLARSQTCR